MRKKKRKLWSVPRIQHPKYPGFTVRISELSPGRNVYAVRMVNGRQKMTSLRRTRADLGKDDKTQERAARALALDLIEELATGTDNTRTEAGAGEALTLSSLVDRYQRRGFFGRTERYQRDQVNAVRRVATYLGPQRRVAGLKPSDAADYQAHRQAEGVRVAARSDLMALRIACNWARREGLLDVNPLAPEKVKLQRTQKPRRPVADERRYLTLRGVANQLPPMFGVLLDLAWSTGRRIGAVLGLRWQDIDFEQSESAPHGQVRWYAGRAHTTKAHDQVVPINTLAREALERWRDECPGIGNSYVFPTMKNPAKPIGRHHAKEWLGKAEQLAGLEHVAHDGWHGFRRGWATQRKHLPLVDVAEAGGWYDTGTLVKSYQHSDPKTRLAVIEHTA